MLSPRSNLAGECGHTKVAKANKTKKKQWRWEEVHQQAFNIVKAIIAHDVTLVCPDCSKGIEIYTDSSKSQLEQSLLKTRGI